MSIAYEDPSLYESLQRETDITWELIAEMSKNQTCSVYEMLKKYYNDKCLQKSESDSKDNLQKYLSYPENEINK